MKAIIVLEIKNKIFGAYKASRNITEFYKLIDEIFVEQTELSWSEFFDIYNTTLNENKLDI